MRALRSRILQNTYSTLTQQWSKKNNNSFKLARGLFVGFSNPSRFMNLNTLKLSHTFATSPSSSGSFDMMWQQAYNKLKDVDSKEIFD